MNAAELRRVMALVLATSSIACQFETTPITPPGEQQPFGMAPPAAPPVPAPAEQPDAHDPTSAFGNPGAPGQMSNVGPSSAGLAAPPPSELDAGSPMAMADARIEDPAVPPDAAPMHNDAAVASPDAAGPIDPVPPEPGTAFSACTQNTDCSAGLLCTASAMWWTPGATGYCTAFCGSSGTATAACPQPTSGQVGASCRFDTLLCMLDSCERSQCPLGMHCVEAQMPIGGGQVVDVFSCQP